MKFPARRSTYWGAKICPAAGSLYTPIINKEAIMQDGAQTTTAQGADENLDMTEIRVLELIRDALKVSDDGAAAIEHAARARHMTLEEIE